MWQLAVLLFYNTHFNGGIIPTYLVVQKLGLINSLWSLLLPGLTKGFYVIMLYNYFTSIPSSIEESAKIDGASEWRIFWQIVMPNVKPAWLTLIIFSVQGLWNARAQTVIYSEAKKTLTYALQQIQAGGLARAGQAAAVTVIMMIVPIAIFILSQTQILETMASSGIKE